MKYAIFMKLDGGRVDRSMDFPGEYDNEYLAKGVADIYGKAVGRPYIVREVPERELGAPVATVDVDLQDQYHKVLGELIAVKEERNSLRAAMLHAGKTCYVAAGVISLIRRKATTVQQKSLFGNTFAKSILNHDDHYGDIQAALENIAQGSNK